MDSHAQLNSYVKEEFISHYLDGLTSPYTFLNSIIVPRPIALITTQGANGVINAAPFSYFSAVCMQPAILSVCIERRNGQKKDTAYNIFLTKEFVVNICSTELAQVVSQTGRDLPREISELEGTQLSIIPSDLVSVPRLANTPIQLECRLKTSIDVEDTADLVLGEIVKVHLHKNILTTKGTIDFEKLNPLARLAGKTYAKLGHFFEVSL